MSEPNCYWVRYKDFANRANKTVRVVARSSAEAVAYFKKKNPKCEVLKCSLDFIGMDKELLDKWNNIILKWTNIAMTYDELIRFLNYAALHKNELIKHLEELDVEAGKQ